ncbi:MAG: cytochrome c, partial [Saprospiraceae bacterium]|nr:cytochrome c [Saprospiraceae bacterium]
CHNLQIEDPDLTVASPEARLSYVSEKGLPFLQGTTLYGAINRTSFYNGDYYKKYGELVETARHDIRNAIQLCATECAQGRALEPWEMESIMAYFWDIGFRMSDLDLNEKERERIKNASSDEEKLYARELIKSKYLSGSPATFVPPPADRNVGTGLSGNYESGKKIYELSCLHCHLQERYSFFDLEKNNMSVDFLRNKMATYSSYSIYQVIRWGVPSYSGRTSYMPQYPLEKLSDQQLADLREFLEKGY